MSELERLREEYEDFTPLDHVDTPANRLITALEAELERVNWLLAEASKTLDLLIKGVDS